MITALALFAGSLAVLLAAARAFTWSAERIGGALGLSPFTTGVLIVSAGTSLPELVASVVAVTRVSRWEGLLFLMIYGLFILEVARLA